MLKINKRFRKQHLKRQAKKRAEQAARRAPEEDIIDDRSEAPETSERQSHLNRLLNGLMKNLEAPSKIQKISAKKAPVAKLVCDYSDSYHPNEERPRRRKRKQWKSSTMVVIGRVKANKIPK